ncbi:type II secretion system protein [bacterium]|nr:type II secretion system protein [bacterium]
MKKAFTLIELLIVITILGILTLVLFSAYNKISEISFRVEQERKVNEELLFLSEVLQNFANRNSIDFDKYTGDFDLTNST